MPLVFGSIFQFEGQVSVFHLPNEKHSVGICYRDLYPVPPPEGLAQNCGEAGVIGVLPGIIGAMQANEAVKVITGLGETLSGYLLIFNALTGTTRRLVLAKRDHDLDHEILSSEIDYKALLQALSSTTPPFLLDIRDYEERQNFSLGGEHIPLAMLPENLSILPDNKTIVIYCKSGVRSARASLYLRQVLPKSTVLSLRGGVDACNINDFTCVIQ